MIIKPILSIISVISLLLVLGCDAPSLSVLDESVGDNGSFEIVESGLPVNWYVSRAAVESGDAKLSFDPVDAFDGSQSLKIEVNQVAEGSWQAPWQAPWIFRTREAEPGKTYAVSYHLKSTGCVIRQEIRNEGKDPLFGFSDEEQLDLSVHPPIWTTITEEESQTNEWRQFKTVYTVPLTDGTIRFHLFIMSPCTLWIDNFSIEKIPVGDCIGADKAITGVIDDFSSGLPTGKGAGGVEFGFATFQDSHQDTSVLATTSSQHPPLPSQVDDNQVLQLNFNVLGYAGIRHGFMNKTGDQFVSQNWCGHEAFSFMLHGNNSGTGLFVEVLDNRNPDSLVDDFEVYTYPFVDDFSGWKEITVPFDQMTRKEIYNDAPHDGLGLSEVHGWAFGVTDTKGPLTFYIDDFSLR